MILWATLAGAAEPEDVRQSLDEHIVLNWTRLTLEVSASADAHGIASNRRTVEQHARREVGPRILEGVSQIPVDHKTKVSDLEADPALGEPIRSRISRWTVTESRYYASGRVELLGELPLQTLLKPWVLASAVSETTPEESSFTGLILDARGLRVHPAYAPRILAEDGEVVFTGQLSREAAVAMTPVVYVADAAHPVAAQRGGAEPLFLDVSSVRGPDLVLSEESMIRVRAGLSGTERLHNGQVVIVVDP